MRLKTAFLSLALLICPCALCYGQLSFSGVNGERGYAALRAYYRLDLDNGFVFTPMYGYYRMTDKEIELIYQLLNYIEYIKNHNQ